MSKAEHEASPRAALVCPVCKQSVTTRVKGRHKTLGIFVPVWRPGPCHNAECSEYLKDSKQSGHRDH
ncbi:hypothetical protein [Streptomyces sp. NPDC058625]|uniref:hypothetical protein n=1 Tax=Streptomyces sp. NPDC058625 TaxID=3346564 RepID=UPI003663EC03